MQVLTDLLTFDTSRLIFDQSKKVVKPKYSYQKIQIKIHHENGEGPLYVMLKDVQSFGINTFQGEGKKAHSISIKLWKNPTEEQALWLKKFEELVQTCVNYVVHNKKKIGVSVCRSDLEGPRGGASPLKYAVSDDGEEQVRVVDSAPCMYPKVKSYVMKGGEVWKARFVDSETREDLDPESLEGVKLDLLKCVLVVDNIFIGPRWKSVQVFVKEALVKTCEEVSFLDLK